MNRISVNEVRSVLVAGEFLSEAESLALSDEQLMDKSFQEDLCLDSLDFVLLLQKLEDSYKLSPLDMRAWDCRTVRELIELSAQ